jgi:hypothetical protein
MRDRRHRRPCCLSWSSRLFRVLICARLPGSLGSPDPVCPRRFRRDCRCPPRAVRRSLALTASSPRELRSPSESSVLCPPSVSPPPAPSMGFAVPLRDVTGQRPCHAAPSPRSLSVHGVSNARDGFLRHSACGFVSPRSHVQGLLFRGFPSRAAAPARRRRCRALSSIAADPLTMLPPPPRIVVSPSGLSSASRIRCRRFSC